jgi:hypothetical protein
MRHSPGRGGVLLDGGYPAIPALQGGVKGYNIKEIPCRKAPPFRAESLTQPGWVEAI